MSQKGVKEMRGGLGPKGRGGYGGGSGEPATPKPGGMRSPTENYVAGRSEAVKPPKQTNVSQPMSSIGDEPGLMGSIPMMAGPVSRPTRQQLEARKAAVAAVLSGQADDMIAKLMGGAGAPATVGAAAPAAAPAPAAPAAAAPPAVSAATATDPAQEQKMLEELYKIYGLRK